MKKIYSLILSAALLLSVFTPSFSSEENEELADGILEIPSAYSAGSGSGINNYYLPKVFLGAPVSSFNSSSYSTAAINGKDYLYTSINGSPSIFNVYNIDDRKVVFSKELVGARSPWVHISDSKGMLYIISNRNAYRYNPYEMKLEGLGFYLFSENSTFTACIDDNDNLYIGTYPNAKIVKYDPVENTFTDMGEIDESANYIRSMVYHKGFIYAATSGGGAKPSYYYKVDVNNFKNVTAYPAPDISGYYDTKHAKSFYNASLVGDCIFISAQTDTGMSLLVFDTVTCEYVDIGFREAFKGYTVPPAKNNKTYFRNGSNDWFSYDIQTKELKNLEFKGEFPSLWGGDWVTIEGEEEFPGESLAVLNTTTSDPVFINFETKQTSIRSNVGFAAAKAQINTIENGSNQDLYISAFLGVRGTRYDIKNHEFTEFNLGQAEGSTGYQGKQYFGVYAGAYIYAYDPEQSSLTNNPVNLGKLGERQDRPYALLGAEDKIYIGTMPDYGQLGGALSWYDLKEQKFTVIRNIVQNQMVIDICYRNGKIYGSTNISGGLGSIPTETAAKIFIFNTATNQKEKEFTPKIPGVATPLFINAIEFDESGKLWATAGNTLFSVDPQTEEVIDVLNFGDYFFDSQASFPHQKIVFDKKGYLYVNLNGMKVVNTKTLEYEDLTPIIGPKTSTDMFTIGSDNNLYFRDSNDNGAEQLIMLPISDEELKVENLSAVKRLLQSRITLSLDHSVANVYGNIKKIDSDSKPFFQYGKVMVPIRFLAECLGAKVSWNCKKQTVSLTKADQNVAIKADSLEMTVNDEPRKLDVPAVLKDRRLYVQADAVASAFSKTTYYNRERNILSIMDKVINDTEEMVSYTDLYFKYYIYEDFRLQQDAAKKKEMLDDGVKALNGKVIEIPNADFEKEVSAQFPVPDFNLMYGLGEKSKAYVSNLASLSGNQALYISENSNQSITGYETDYLKVNPNKKLRLLVGIYPKLMYTSIGVNFYDQETKLIDRQEYLQYSEIRLGVWNIIQLDLPMTSNEIEYCKIQLFTPSTYLFEGYYDCLTLVEYEGDVR